MKGSTRKRLIPSLAALIIVAAATFVPLAGFLTSGNAYAAAKLPIGAITNIVSNVASKVPSSTAAKVPDKLPADTTAKVPDKLPADTTAKVSDKLPADTAAKVSDKLPDGIAVKVSDKLPAGIATEVSDKLQLLKRSLKTLQRILQVISLAPPY
jgi:hypothetical protein